jgi:hypothetical protein
VKAPKAEPYPNKMSVKGVSQIGQAIGNHITESSKILKGVSKPVYDGRGYAPPVGPTDNVSAVGVGGGRNRYAKGSQAQWGSVNPGGPKITNTRGQWPDSKR